MEFLSRISTETELDKIFADLSQGVSGRWDIAFIFISGFNEESTKLIADHIRDGLGLDPLIGCAGFGVIGPGKEIEDSPSVSLLLGRLPGVRCMPFYFDQARYESLTSAEEWYDLMDVYPNEKPKFIVFTESTNTAMNVFLEGINQSYPDSPVVGALTGVDNNPKQNLFIFNQKYYSQGLLGVCLIGNIHIETIVSQGCRPIGESYIVTQVEDNIIYELAGRPFYEVLEDVINDATEGDQKLAQDAIFIGIAMNEYKHRMKQGDFMIRLLMAIDDESGAGIITDTVQVGQTVRFHVRDPVSADLDLKSMLNEHKNELVWIAPKGGLIFSCSARGEELFGAQNHDTGLLTEYLGDIPVAGFFSAGELGPVYGKNYLHGVSICIALFFPEEK
jgi:small ligand-binding sensory domain FIST